MRSKRLVVVRGWSSSFAAAIHRHLTRGAKVLDICSGTHDIPLRRPTTDSTLAIHAVDANPHMIAEGENRVRRRNLTIYAQVCDAHT